MVSLIKLTRSKEANASILVDLLALSGVLQTKNTYICTFAKTVLPTTEALLEHYHLPPHTKGP